MASATSNGVESVRAKVYVGWYHADRYRGYLDSGHGFGCPRRVPQSSQDVQDPVHLICRT